MVRKSWIFVAALAAFAAGWQTRGAVRPDGPAPARALAPALVVPVGDPAASRALDPSRRTSAKGTVRSLARTGRDLAPDSIGVLLERRFDQPSREPAVDDYLLYLPPGLERGDRAWPVVLYLHGRSLSGDDLSMLTRYGLPRYLAEGRVLPFVVVAPQAPVGEGWTDVDRLVALLDDVLARYPVDRNRVYLTGYSMGGGGVWRMALAHPDLFATAAPMAATTPAPSRAWERAVARLPMRVFHGTADEVAPFADAEAMVADLRRAGADVELRAYPGARHGDLTRIYGHLDLYDWFLAHRRAEGGEPATIRSTR